MPVALALLFLAWLGGGTGIEEGDQAGAVLAGHVALVLAGFAVVHPGRGHGRAVPVGGASPQAT